MVAAQCDELLANRAASIGLALAALGMLHHSLHLLTRRQRTVGIAALASMHQRLNAALDAEASTLLWALVGLAALVVAVVVQAQSPLHHLVLVALGVVAVNA